MRDVRNGVAYLGDGREPDDVSAYNAGTGDAQVDYIPGFRSYLAQLDAGEEKLVKAKEIK